MNDRPLIPKRLASKIHAAQQRVNSARSDLFETNERIKKDTQRIAEYEANPSAFARKYYGQHPAESYPVQTNISRCKEGLEYRQGRVHAKNTEVANAEAKLQEIEDKILKEVLKMRPSHGRVAWPKSIGSPEDFEKEAIAERKRWQEESEKREAEIQAELAGLEHLSEIEQELKDEQSLKEWKEHLAGMTPEQLAIEKEATARLKEALDSGKITPLQIIHHLRSKQRL